TSDNACVQNQCSNDAAKVCTSDSDCIRPGVCNATEARCDGTNIPAPHTDPAKQFFLPPEKTAGINCVQFHDNGPWMNSRWMNNIITLEDDPSNPYVNNGTHFADGAVKWKETIFVTPTRDGL